MIKKQLIIALYFIVYWIILPLGLTWISGWLDKNYFYDKQLPGYAYVLGWVILIPALYALLYSVFQFKKFSGVPPVSALPPGRLIEKGLFTIWRHPIYLFAGLVVLGLALINRSCGFLFIMFPVFIIALFIYIKIEEHFLEKRFGEKYILYKKRIPLFFPKFNEIIRIIAKPFFRSWFRLRILHPENIPDSPPYFVVAAHRNYLDPFIISYSVPHMIRHICTYEMFRGLIKPAIFNIMGAIPKKRFKTDYQSNKQIIRALNDGYVVGVFPEGERSWTGEIQSLKDESLVMFLHNHTIPILPVILQGNYQSWPRWSDRLLRANLQVLFGEPFYLDPKMDLNSAQSLITEKISSRSENEKSFICMTKDKIGKLSIVIYRCPDCLAFETMKEVHPDQLVCSACKNKLEIMPDLTLKYAIGDENNPVSIADVYQKIRIKETDLNEMHGNLNASDYMTGLDVSEELIYKSDAEYYREKGASLKLISKGQILLTNQRILIISGNQEQILNLSDVDAVTIESNNKLQLYQTKNDCLVQLKFLTSSALLWQDLISLIVQKKFGKKVITR